MEWISFSKKCVWNERQKSSLAFYLIFCNVYFCESDRERDRDREWAGEGGERGRHRIQRRLQALSCQHRSQRGARTHEPWDHDLSWGQMLNQLTHPSAPKAAYKTSSSFTKIRSWHKGDTELTLHPGEEVCNYLILWTVGELKHNFLNMKRERERERERQQQTLKPDDIEP